MPGEVRTISGEFFDQAANGNTLWYRYSVSWLVETRILWKAVVRPEHGGRGAILGGERVLGDEDTDLEGIARRAVEEAIKAGIVLPEGDPSGG
jgi:hypothetical protein